MKLGYYLDKELRKHSKKATVWGQCLRKTRYETEEAAQVRISKQKVKLCTYKCKKCCGFHITKQDNNKAQGGSDGWFYKNNF